MVTPAPPPTVTPPTVQAAPAPRPDAPATLESLLVRFRLVTPDQIQEAIDAQRATGRPVAEIVVERGWVTHDQVTRVLAYVPGAAPTPQPAAVAPAPAPSTPEPPKVEASPPAAAPAAVAPAPVAATEPVTARVYVRLMGGDRVEVASLDDLGAAKRRAAELVDELLGADGSWPFMAGRFIRPEAIVSIDVEASPA